MNLIEHVEECRRHWHGSVDAPLPFLCTLNNDGAVFEVDSVCSQRQSFRDPASGIRESGAERANFSDFRFIGRIQESIALGGGQVFAMTVMVVESIHGADLS